MSELSDVLGTVVNRVKKQHGKVEYLPKAVRQMEGKIRQLFQESGKVATVNDPIHDAIDLTVKENDNGNGFAKEFDWFRLLKNWATSNLPDPPLILIFTKTKS
ncbi:MAG: hypothetical protein R2788_01300 [Saprospiraceae bacterium]